MGKGNQVPEVVMKDTKIPEFDEFFDKSSDPLNSMVSWNNELDGYVKEMRALGSDLKGDNAAAGAPTLKVEVKDSVVSVLLVKGSEPFPAKSLDKVAKEYFSMVEKKAKLVNSRLKTLQKLAGLESSTLKVVKGFQLVVSGDEDSLKTHKKDDALLDMQRSLTKFNDRAGLLVMQLKGPVTVSEAAFAILENLKSELKEKASEIKISLEDGMPKIEGIPDNIEDFVPSLVARGWSLLKGMIDFLIGLKDQIPELQSKIEALGEEAKEFPGKLKDAASQANLGAMELVKATKAVTGNIKLLSGAPAILKVLLDTVRSTLLEIGGAVTGRVQGAQGASSPVATNKADNSSGDEQ